MRELVVSVGGGRTLQAYDSEVGTTCVVWHPGSPHTGAPPWPLLSAAAERGMRVVTYARPSYGGSTPAEGRSEAAGAADTVRVADALGVDRFAALGYSGGGPPALGCAALFPDRVTGVVTFACLAPYSEEFDWFAGMTADGALRSALAGRVARRAYAETDEFDPEVFTGSDWATLSGDWAALGQDAQQAGAAGPDGLVDDDIALVSPWGFALAAVRGPVLLVHGDEDRIAPYAHGEWLQRQIPGAQLLRRPGAGHVAVLTAMPQALDRLLALT